MSRLLRLSAAAALAAALAPPAAARAEVTRTLRLELEGDPGGSFAVENLAGAMEVRQGSGAQVVAVATVHAETQTLADAVRFEQVSGKNGVPTLRVRYPEGRDRFRYPGSGGASGMAAWFGGGRTTTRYDGRRVSVSSSGGDLVYADLVVEIPASTGEGIFLNHVGPIAGRELKGRRLAFDSAAGEIALKGIEAEVSADTGSGDVAANGIKGRFRCDTGSGECRLEAFDGDRVECDTGSGRIRIAGARAERIEADTGSGDIRLAGISAEHLEMDTGSGDVEVEAEGGRLISVRADTGSGDVRLRLGDDASFELRADSGSGEIESGFRDAEPIRRDREIVGWRRGDARTRIRVDTGSGDVRVEP